MPNIRPSFHRSVVRSVVLLAGLALSASLGCRNDTTQAPPVAQTRTGGKSGGNTDPDRGSGGKTGTGGDVGMPGAGGAVGGGGGDTPSDAPIEAFVPQTDAFQEPEVGSVDVPVTCATACDPTEMCSNGQCVAICMPGQTKCPMDCADLQTDGANCGACGKACPAGQFCSVGKCVAACKDGETRCGTSCVTLNSNAKNCGACGRACSGAEACVNQVCQCNSPNKVCGTTCTNVRNNPKHCGTCGNVCEDQFVCNGTTCGCPGGRRECPNLPGECVTSLNECCTGSDIWCGGTGGHCFDKNNDRNNCGACGAVCPAALVCSKGKCVCAANQDACPDGTCVDKGACCGNQKKCGNGTCVLKGDCCEACTDGTVCSGGACVCKNTDQDCGGKCITKCVAPNSCDPGSKSCKPPADLCAGSNCKTCLKCDPADGICKADNGTKCGGAMNGTCMGGTCGCKDTEQDCGGVCVTKCKSGETCNADMKKCVDPCATKTCGACEKCTVNTAGAAVCGADTSKNNMTCSPPTGGKCMAGVCQPPADPCATKTCGACEKCTVNQAGAPVCGADASKNDMSCSPPTGGKCMAGVCQAPADPCATKTCGACEKCTVNQAGAAVCGPDASKNNMGCSPPTNGKCMAGTCNPPGQQ
jgi:hypothetical protein